ncbi:MAG: LysR substrate-binding domain-containing protein [Desulfomonilaceae bacterium]
MEMRHLRYFVAVAENLHFGRAAEQLHMCQPPLSQQIKSLEEELGLLLFCRKNKRVTLTDAGRAFLEDAREILQRTESASERARDIANGMLGLISLAFVLPAMDTFFPKAIREFRPENPRVEIRLLEMGTLAQLDALAAGSIDLGVMRLFQQDTRGLVVEKIVEEPYVLAIPSQHPLALSRTVPLAALDSEPLIFFPRRNNPPLHDRIMACCHAVGCRPRISQEAILKVTAIALAEAGVGIALVPASAKKQRRTGVVFRKISGELPMVELSLVWRAEMDLPAVQHLVQTVRKVRDRRP